MATRSITFERQEGLYLKKTRKKGRGVFCTENIEEGDELEITPSLLLSEDEIESVRETVLQSYAFSVGNVSKQLRRKANVEDLEAAGVMIMGIASFCNHDEEPNAEIVWEEKNGTLYHTLVATRDIPKDTEICTTYGEGWFDDKDFKCNSVAIEQSNTPSDEDDELLAQGKT